MRHRRLKGSLKCSVTVMVFFPFNWRIKSLLLRMKHVFKHQDLQILSQIEQI